MCSSTNPLEHSMGIQYFPAALKPSPSQNGGGCAFHVLVSICDRVYCFKRVSHHSTVGNSVLMVKNPKLGMMYRIQYVLSELLTEFDAEQ
jgi:hypothetical protein